MKYIIIALLCLFSATTFAQKRVWKPLPYQLDSAEVHFRDSIMNHLKDSLAPKAPDSIAVKLDAKTWEEHIQSLSAIIQYMDNTNLPHKDVKDITERLYRLYSNIISQTQKSDK